jgi:transcriptional regulator with XRE-family HTH domain
MDKTIYSAEYAALLRVLKRTRAGSGITQTELAEQLGMSQSAYSKLERGELRIDVIQLRIIATKIGVSLVDFIGDLEKEIGKRKPRKRKSSRRK